MATPQGQIPLRAKGQATCIEHKGEHLCLYCEKCDDIICHKCLSTSHKCHDICELSVVTPKMKQDIQNFIDKTEQNDLVQVREHISSTETLLKDNTSRFEKHSHELKLQTDQLKHKLDFLTEQSLCLYHKMEEDNAKLIQTYKQDLERYDKQLGQQIKECKKALQHGSHVNIFETGCEIHSQISLPVKPVLVAASFTPNKIPHQHLEQAIGQTEIFNQGESSTDQDGSVRTSNSQEPSSVLQQSETEGKKTMTRYKLPPQTKALTQWRSPVTITSLCPTNDGQVWTSNHYSDALILLDRKGNVIQQVKLNNNINDISWSPKTQTLWVCDTENKILELEPGRLTHRFRTKKEPKCICVTTSNNVIVGMTKHISKFSTQGEIVLTTSATGTGEPLVCSPYRISECPITGNVAVVDWNDVNDGGDGEQHVVVMDKCFKKRFVYKGDIPITYAKSSHVGAEQFNPNGVAFNSTGNIIIGDSDNYLVLLLSGGGEFLRIIHSDTKWTMAISVDREDVLWAVFGGLGWRKVKLLPTAVCNN